MNAVSAVCTLYELGQALAGLQNKKRFEELHLGPLCKNPLIHKMFKVDANTKDEDINPVTTVDILRVGVLCPLLASLFSPFSTITFCSLVLMFEILLILLIIVFCSASTVCNQLGSAGCSCPMVCPVLFF